MSPHWLRIIGSRNDAFFCRTSRRCADDVVGSQQCARTVHRDDRNHRSPNHNAPDDHIDHGITHNRNDDESSTASTFSADDMVNSLRNRV
jgi:hypothetical protein